MIAVMAQPQSYKTHARWDPPFHFLIAPLLLLNFVFAIYATIHSWPFYRHTHLWWIVMSIVFIMMAGNSRVSALRAQDRVIRLEEQLRLADLLPENELGLIDALKLRQFIGLRFASDAEVAALAKRAVSENLSEKQIKENVTHWRADNHRV